MSEKLLSPKGLELLNKNSWSSIKYYYNADNDTYYEYREGSGNYNFGSIYYNPIDKESALHKKLAVEYPRSEEDVGEDINPVLETTTTIKTKPSETGVEAPAGAGGSVRFPSDIRIGAGEDFVMFDFYDYRPPFKEKASINQDFVNQTLEQYNASGFNSKYFKNKAYSQIIMYMPQDVQDQFQANWEGKKFGTNTAGIVASAGRTGMVSKLEEATKALKGAVDRGTVEAGAAIVTKLSEKLTGDSITAGDLFGGISGVARNPNVELLFQSMKLRTFDLTFKMAPFGEVDVQNMETIIRIFKRAMLPEYKLGDTPVFGTKGENSPAIEAGFIKVPKVVHVNYMRGGERNRFLPRYKMCAITDVNVNYTPDNVYATFDRSSPVAVEIKISFMETKLVFSEDIAERGF